MGNTEDILNKLNQIKLEVHNDSPMPMYYQLSRIFIRLIQDEVFLPNARFPSEEAISKYFNVSRPTANKAIQILLNEEWLIRDKQDKRSGTYVKEKPYTTLGFFDEGLSFVDHFPEGVPIKSRTVWKKIIPASSKVARNLNLVDGDRVVHLRRLRYAFDKPIMVCDSHFSDSLFPDLNAEDLIQESLYTTMELQYNCPIVYSERYAMAIEAVETEVIQLLDVLPFTSILMITGISYTDGNQPIDYLQTYLQPGVSLKNRISKHSAKDKEQINRT